MYDVRTVNAMELTHLAPHFEPGMPIRFLTISLSFRISLSKYVRTVIFVFELFYYVSGYRLWINCVLNSKYIYCT